MAVARVHFNWDDWQKPLDVIRHRLAEGVTHVLNAAVYSGCIDASSDQALPNLAKDLLAPRGTKESPLGKPEQDVD